MVPDVAMQADPDSGVLVYSQYQFEVDTDFDPFPLPDDESQSNVGWYPGVGGTSLSSPMWAGLIAIVDQGRALNGLAPLASATNICSTDVSKAMAASCATRSSGLIW